MPPEGAGSPYPDWQTTCQGIRNTVQDRSICVRQLYLTALAGEEAMLATFTSWLPEDAVFVSYNGRSYDALLLKGVSLQSTGHLDAGPLDGALRDRPR